MQTETNRINVNIGQKIIGFSLPAIISGFIGFIIAPINTRLFLPEELGKINLFMTYSVLISSICFFGYDQVYVRNYHEFGNEKDRKSLLSYCLAISSAVSVFILLALIIFYQKISILILGTPSLLIILLLFVYSFFLVLFTYFTLAARFAYDIKRFILISLANTFTAKIAIVITAFFYASAWFGIINMVIATTFFLSLYFLMNRKELAPFRGVFNASHKAFFLHAAPFPLLAVLSWSYSSIAPTLLRGLVDFNAIGIYSGALAIASAIGIVQMGFQMFWPPYFLEHYKDDTNNFEDMHRIIVFVMLLVFLCIMLFQDGIYLILGPNYRSSKAFFSLLFIQPICYTISETTGYGIMVARKSWLYFFVYLISTTVNIGLSVYLIPKLGISGAAIASAVSGIVMLVTKTMFGEKYFRIITNYKYLIFAILLMSANAVIILLSFAKTVIISVQIFSIGILILFARTEVKTLVNWVVTYAQIAKQKLNRR